MTDSTDDCVFLGIRDSIATITFDQRLKRNAMQLRTWRALPALIDAAVQDPTAGLIVLRGAGGTFGAGNDLDELAALHGNAAAAEEFGRAMADAMLAVELASKPVLVAIERQCYGASVALALSGDMRIAADDATFAITPAKLGAVYLRSDLHRLVAAIGPGQSRMLIYSARTIDAARARDIGLVDDVVPSHRFEEELTLWTGAILRGSPSTLRLSKKMLRTVGQGPTPPETNESLAQFAGAMQSGEFAEGVKAFLEKRLPQFR